MPILMQMPKWGLTMKAGTVTEWLVAEGAEVSGGQLLVVVETDKISSEVEAPADGTLRKIVAAAGVEVPVMGAVAVLAAPGETLSDEEVQAFLDTAQAQLQQAAATRTGGARVAREARAAIRDEEGRVNASPAARKLARELGVDLAAIPATGPGGRITSDDVQRAAAEQAGAREDWVTLPDGRRLFYVLAGPATAATPLVLLHGLGGSQSTWQVILPDLAADRRVLAPDLPGHGQSDTSAPPLGDYSVTGLARAVIDTLEALQMPRVALAGHSLGGAVAIQVALERPTLVTHLVLIDSAGLGDEISAELLELVEAAPSRETARRLLRLFFHDRRFVLESGVEETYEASVVPGVQEAVRAAAGASFGASGQRLDLLPRLSELHLPVQIIWGAQDAVIPAAHATAGAAAIPGARTLVLDGVGHVPQIEAAAQVSAAIGQFLKAPIA